MTVRSAERWVAGLVVSIVGQACGGAEPDPAGATEDGTSTGAATSTGRRSRRREGRRLHPGCETEITDERRSFIRPSYS